MSKGFEKFIQLDVLKLLGREGTHDVELGDAISKKMAISFIDIRDFKKQTEAMNAKECIEFTNELLKYISPELVSNNGILQRFVGDAVLLLFPTVEDAVKASVNIVNTLNDVNKSRQDKPQFSVGIGIHYGPVILGIIGGENHYDITSIGDSISIAARVRSLTKTFGATILVTGTAINAIKNKKELGIKFRIIGSFFLGDRDLALDLYDVVFSTAQSPHAFERALNFFKLQSFAEAEKVYASQSPEDKVAAFMTDVCKMYQVK